MSIKKDDAGFSGMLGRRVTIGKLAGKTTITSKPHRQVGKLSEKQLAHQERFLEAAEYARDQMGDAEVKALYASRITGKKQTAYNLAVGDYLVAPEVQRIDTRLYQGRIGDLIKIKAKDDFQVISVQVEITDGDGNLLEQGTAEPPQRNKRFWSFTATVDNPSLTGSVVKVIASDRPGNETEREQVL